ncbi:MAG: TAXI family TRAP transporter solute-binding subunit [Beijerinckiaceae bacterium]|jgi:uncharacterized protein|nr:TAXI family TRAP transporter solute-binding subunit [Beijerinckiaceae bacterium]
MNVRKLVLTSAAGCFSASLALPALAQVIIMGTTTQGSLAYNTGVAISKVVSSKAGLQMRPQPLGGTSDYIPKINRKEVMFGPIVALDTFNAVRGNIDYSGKKQENLRIVGVAYPLRTGLVVPADSPIKTLSDLQKHKGLRVPAQYTSMKLIEQQVDMSLRLGGVKYDDFKKVPVSGFVQGMFALGQGKVDISWISLGSAAGRKIDAQLRSRGGFRYLDVDLTPAGQAMLEKELPPVSVVLEKNVKMPGIKVPTRIFQQNMLILTHKDAPDEIVYKVAKVLATEKMELAKSFGAFFRMDPKAVGTDPSAPYHPAAVKAYKELGLKIR